MKKNKIIIYLFLTIICFFVPHISYADSISCSTLNDIIEEYNEAEEKLEELSCLTSNNNENSVECYNYDLKKNQLLSQIFKYNDETNCSNSQLNSIINNNKDNCSNVFGSTIKDITNWVMGIFYLIAPFLLIIFGSVDLIKIVVSPNPITTSNKGLSTIGQARRNIIRRIIALILLYMSPVLVNLILNFNFSINLLNGDVYTCKTKVSFQLDKWETNYVPRGLFTTGNSIANSVNSIVVGGITTDTQAESLNSRLTSMLNTVYHDRNNPGVQQKGPFPKWWDTPINSLSKFQCTWWANGRASQYLEEHGTKYKSYPTQWGDGGEYYGENVKGGWFKYGQTPKPNSIISWTQGGRAGHVAYVEGVTKDGIYISHAGSGSRWFGVQKISIDGDLNSIGWSGYTLNGYIYLDEPN